MITVDTLAILNKLKNHENGETAYVNQEQKVYQYVEDTGWIPKELPEGKINLSIYDMNKQIVDQLSPIEDIAVLTTIRKYKNLDGKYFMLICRDIGYYTLFAINPDSDVRIEQEVLECLKELGTVKSIEQIEGTDTLEIWVQPKDDTSMVMYFFNYDKGVIQCH